MARETECDGMMDDGSSETSRTVSGLMVSLQDVRRWQGSE